MRTDPEALRLIINDRALVRLLTIISQEDGCPTRKLLKRLGSNDLHPLLARAESKGYITREEEKPEGKGNHLVRNYLTKKGKSLAAMARRMQP